MCIRTGGPKASQHIGIKSDRGGDFGGFNRRTATQRSNRPFSGRVLHMVLRKFGAKVATVHGFRSSFRDWAGNVSNFPREVTETALAHVIGDKAEQAYRRGDALEKRRKLMEAWASYCEPKKAGNVIQIGTHVRA